MKHCKHRPIPTISAQLPSRSYHLFDQRSGTRASLKTSWIICSVQMLLAKHAFQERELAGGGAGRDLVVKRSSSSSRNIGRVSSISEFFWGLLRIAQQRDSYVDDAFLTLRGNSDSVAQKRREFFGQLASGIADTRERFSSESATTLKRQIYGN